MKNPLRIFLSIAALISLSGCSESFQDLFNRVGREYVIGRWIVENVDPLTPENLSMLDICLAIHSNLSFNAYQPLYKDSTFNTDGSWGFFTNSDSNQSANDSIITFKSYQAKSYQFQIINRNLSDSSMLVYHLKKEQLIVITKPRKFPTPTELRPHRIETAFSNIIAGKWKVLYYYREDDPEKTPIYAPYADNLYEFGNDGTLRFNKTVDGKYIFVYNHLLKQASLTLNLEQEHFPPIFDFISMAINATVSRKPEFILRFEENGELFRMLLIRE